MSEKEEAIEIYRARLAKAFIQTEFWGNLIDWMLKEIETETFDDWCKMSAERMTSKKAFELKGLVKAAREIRQRLETLSERE